MDETAPGRRPTKVVLAGVGLFVLAVVLGRLLVAGGAAWVLFAFAVPVVLLVLGAAYGFAAALVATSVFAGLVLLARFVIQANPGGWVALLLVPVVALTAYVVGRVLAQLRRRPEGTPPREGAPGNGTAPDEGQR